MATAPTLPRALVVTQSDELEGCEWFSDVALTKTALLLRKETSGASSPAGQPPSVTVAVHDFIGVSQDIDTHLVLHALSLAPREAPGCCACGMCCARAPDDDAYLRHGERVHVKYRVKRKAAAAWELIDALTTAAVGVTDPTLRRVRVVLNPHGGHGKAKRTLEDIVLPILSLAGLGVDITPTEFAGHTIEMGADFDPASVEGVIFISGDGAVQEFLQGIVSRPDWRSVATRTVIGHIGSGSANALARGLHTLHPTATLHAAIKCRVRPLDATLLSTGDGQHRLSVCGIGWGVPGDIAAGSEEWRSCGGAYRYTWLKCLKGVLARRVHTARVSYTLQGIRPVVAQRRPGSEPQLKYELSGKAHLHAFSLHPDPQWGKLPGLPTRDLVFPPERYGMLYTGEALPLPPAHTLAPLADLPLSTQRRLGTVKGTKARDSALALAAAPKSPPPSPALRSGTGIGGAAAGSAASVGTSVKRGVSFGRPPRLYPAPSVFSSAVSGISALSPKVGEGGEFRSDTLRDMGAFDEAGLLKILHEAAEEAVGAGEAGGAPLGPKDLMRQISVDTRDGRVYFSVGTRDALGAGGGSVASPAQGAAPAPPLPDLPPLEDLESAAAGEDPLSALGGDLRSAYYFLFTHADSALHAQLKSRAAAALHKTFTEAQEGEEEGGRPSALSRAHTTGGGGASRRAGLLTTADWRTGDWLWNEEGADETPGGEGDLDDITGFLEDGGGDVMGPPASGAGGAGLGDAVALGGGGTMSIGRSITRHVNGTVTPPAVLQRGAGPVAHPPALPSPGGAMPPLVLSPRPRRNSAIRTPSAEPEGIARATSLHSAVHPADISVTFADRPSLDMVVSPASASPVLQPDAVTVTSTASPTLAQRAARGPARRAAGGPTAVPWRHETGAYIAVGAVNIASDAFASHPSDGYFDLMLAREGKGMGEVCGLLGRYTVGKEYDSPMMDYYKASAMVITPLTRAARGQCGGWFAWLGRMCGLCACAGTACEDRTQETPLTESHDVEVLNVDGEVLSARGPFHIQHLPALMTAYGDPYRSDTHAPDGK